MTTSGRLAYTQALTVSCDGVREFDRSTDGISLVAVEHPCGFDGTTDAEIDPETRQITWFCPWCGSLNIQHFDDL